MNKSFHLSSLNILNKTKSPSPIIGINHVKTKKKTASPKYLISSIKVTNFKVRIGAAINHDVRVPKYYSDDAKIYEFGTYLEIEGISIYPEEKEGCTYEFTVYGYEPRPGTFDRTLGDYHVREEDGGRKYRKVRGENIPVYDPPKGIGPLQRHRGTQDWIGWAWVPSQIVSDMLAVLPLVQPLYLELHECKIDRRTWIVGLTLQNTDPAEE